MQLCKVGGLVLYSTCSINPIEDEAVITELFRKCNSDAFELIDIQEIIPNLKSRRGMTKWSILDKKEGFKPEKPKEGEPKPTYKPDEIFTIFNKWEEVPKDYKGGLIRETMFPDDEEKMKNVYKIQNTLRILPHDQNTGGFYLALIRKKSHIVFGGGEKKPKASSPKKEKPMTDENEEKKSEP